MSTAKLALAQLNGRGWRGHHGAPKGTIIRTPAELRKLFDKVRATQAEIDDARRRLRLNEAKKILNRIGDTKMTASQIAANDREDKLDKGLIAKLEADMVKLSAAIRKARA